MRKRRKERRARLSSRVSFDLGVGLGVRGDQMYGCATFEITGALLSCDGTGERRAL